MPSIRRCRRRWNSGSEKKKRHSDVRGSGPSGAELVETSLPGGVDNCTKSFASCHFGQACSIGLRREVKSELQSSRPFRDSGSIGLRREVKSELSTARAVVEPRSIGLRREVKSELAATVAVVRVRSIGLRREVKSELP